MIRRAVWTAAVVAIVTGEAGADALKKSLSGLLHHKDTVPAMVNLDAVPAKPKSRPAHAVVAVVGGEKIRKKVLDRFLSERTKGKVKDFDLLDKKQQRALIQEYYLPRFIFTQAKNAIPFEQRKAIYAQAWLAETARQTTVSDDEVKQAYDALVQRARMRSAMQQIPPFDQVKDRLKMELAQRKIVSQLMRGADIRVAENEKGVAGYVGKQKITVQEANDVLAKLTNGMKSWDTLLPNERMQLLQTIAPQKVVAAMAMQNLTLKQKQNVISNVWLQKKMRDVNVTEKELKQRYKQIKKRTKKKKLPSFEQLKPMLQAQIAQEKVMKHLMKQIKVTLK